MFWNLSKFQKRERVKKLFRFLQRIKCAVLAFSRSLEVQDGLPTDLNCKIFHYYSWFSLTCTCYWDVTQVWKVLWPVRFSYFSLQASGLMKTFLRIRRLHSGHAKSYQRQLRRKVANCAMASEHGASQDDNQNGGLVIPCFSR